MSRFRSPDNDLAYGEIPQRWDRERFERIGKFGPSTVEDDYRFTERDRPGRRDVAVAERREVSRPGSRFEERDRFFEEDRTRSRPGPRRRTDRELFGDVDPREIAEMALTPYRPAKSITREEIDIERGPRPGLLRRQSSLDTFDRRPARYEREEYRIPPYTPVPLPIRRRREWEGRYGGYEDEDYREVEIQRERSVHRRRPPKSERSSRAEESPKSERTVKEETKSIHYHHDDHHDESSSSSSSSFDEVDEKKTVVSKAPTKAPTTRAPSTVTSSHKTRSRAPSTRAPSVHESFHETVIEERAPEPEPLPPVPSVQESFHETAFEESVREERRFKKGKTRMPKRLVRREAIMDLGYPFDEEEDFLVLRIALEKEQIDEVIQISEQYKDGEKRRVYKFEEKEEVGIPPPPMGEHEEIQRTEWINPPTVIGARSRRSIRDHSPNVKSSISQRSRSRRPSSPTFVEERKTVIEETRSPSHAPPSTIRAPPPPTAPVYYEQRDAVVEEHVPSHHPGTVVLAEREHRSDRDINAEIRALEAERRALRHERGDEYQVVEYRETRPREEMVIYERERSPPRNTVRVEKDRKARRDAKILAAAMATLS